MGLKITSSVFYATLCLCLISTETPLSYSCATPLKNKTKKPPGMIPAVTHRAEMIAAWCLPKKPRKKNTAYTFFALLLK